MTAHVDTGAPLPRALFDKMMAAKNFQSGMQTLRQIEFALFDMLLHTEHDPAQTSSRCSTACAQKWPCMQPPAFSRTAHTFSHIFAGGYAAGYYSYKWAEVLSADAYAAFRGKRHPDGLPSLSKPAENTARPFWKPAAAARPWNRSRPSAAASPAGRAAAPPGHGGGAQQAHGRLLVGKNAHSHHARPLVHLRFKFQRVLNGRPVTSRMCWPLSVTRGLPSFSRTLATPPRLQSGGQCAVWPWG
jgi:hypothetical protein